MYGSWGNFLDLVEQISVPSNFRHLNYIAFWGAGAVEEVRS